jgi:phosphatidate cytidylyltransferase
MTIQEFGLQWIIYSSLLVIINDSMAYFFGVSMGSRKLFPRLSPKKTLEGFVGAAVSTVMIAIPLLHLVMRGEASSPSPRHAIVIALFVSLVAPFGGI